MAKARLYFDGDNSGIEKEARIYSLTQEVEDKLDSISNFQSEIDDLQDQINNLASRGRYLSTWNAVTGLPETNPQVDPYVYRAGDYYIVSVVGGTNYRPQGSEYHIGVASQALETQLVEVNDLYIYDGVQWIKQGSGSSINVTWGNITGTLSNQTDLQNALNNKANKTDVLEKTNTTSYTPTGDYNPATKKYVDDNDTYIGTSAPTNNVIEGRLWYDTTADVLKVYDGSAWVPTGKTYTAGSHINISNADVISTVGLQEELTAGDNITIGDVCTTESDMKGPCPSGFHVPLWTEWVNTWNIRRALGGASWDGSAFSAAFKLPFSGYRNPWRGQQSNVGSGGMYWSSSASGDESFNIEIGPSSLNATYQRYRGHALSVRPFKNTPTAPDNTRTKLYGTSIEGGGIFWSSTDGLISFSSDGTTRYTMADKNLGATTVRNSGDVLSEVNGGHYYQWGNNYGFSRGSITTSSTKVDASNYGPANPYSSNIFISGLIDADWSSVQNDNLRGGVTQGTYQDCDLIISANDTTYTASDFDIKDLTDSTGLRTAWSGKQDALTAGSHIDITSNVISTTGLQEELVAGENITIGDVCTTESDMKGPCPEGFHVPLDIEWQAVKGVINTTLGLANSGTTLKTYLKIPFAGERNENSILSFDGTNGFYRSSVASDNYSHEMNCSNSSRNPRKIYGYRISAYSIRPFKNTPVTPDISWTVLYQGTGNAGIYHNTTEGIISMSGDGTTWITIADKNLGATTVYNDGDTLSESNCGRYYQWGNNYGFPGIGNSETFTTSTTLVDATGFGPGDYYNSNVFILNGSTYLWDTSGNLNLRGGQTQSTFQDCIYNVISATGGDVLVSDQPNNILTSGMKIWAGTETDFGSLTPDSNTVYLLTAGQSS